MSASEGEMNLSEEERGNKELEHWFKQNASRKGSSPSEEKKKYFTFSKKEWTDPDVVNEQDREEMDRLVRDAVDIIGSIENAMEACSEIEDKQERLSRFEEVLKTGWLNINTITQTINKADSELDTPKLRNTESLGVVLRTLKDEIGELYTQEENDSKRRKTVPISFTPVDDGSSNSAFPSDYLPHTHTDRLPRQRQTDSPYSEFPDDTHYSEEKKTDLDFDPFLGDEEREFCDSLSRKIKPFEKSPLQDENMQKALIEIKLIADELSKIFREIGALASEKEYRKYITKLKNPMACINCSGDTLSDIEKQVTELQRKLLRLYAKQVFEIDINSKRNTTQKELANEELQIILEHIVAIRNAIAEAKEQDPPSEQLAALEEVLREEGILKEQEINIQTMHEVIDSFIEKVHEHYPKLKQELNILKKEIQDYKKKGTEEKAEEDPFRNGSPGETIGFEQYASYSGSSDSALLRDAPPPVQPNSLPPKGQVGTPLNESLNGEPASPKKREGEGVLHSKSSNDDFEDVPLPVTLSISSTPLPDTKDSCNGQLPSAALSLAPTSSLSIQTDVTPSSFDALSSGETDSAASPNPSLIVQAGIFFGKQLEGLLDRINAFEKENETAYKVIRAIAITTVVLGVVIGITAATCGIGSAALAIGGAIATHAAITEGVVALGALCIAGFFGRKCGKKERAEEDKLREGTGQDNSHIFTAS